jgi:nucleoid-associated protein YgaU
MKKTPLMTRPAVIAGAVLAILVLAILGFFLLRGGGDRAPPQVAIDLPAAGEPVGKAPDAESGPPEPAAELEPELEAPSFDIVRVEPSGETVIAGRAAPGSEVTVLDNEKVLGTVKADESGQWVFLPEQPLEPGAHELALRAKAPETAPAQPAEAPEGSGSEIGTAAVQTGEQVVAVTVGEEPATQETRVAAGAPAVPEPDSERSRTASSEAPQPAAGTPALVVDSEDVVVVVVPEREGAEGAPGAAEPERPIAMLTPRSGQGPSQVLQQPGDGGIVDRDLELNAIDYDDAGRVVISGRAAPGATVVVYLNSQLIGRVSANGDGRWQLVPTMPVAAGLHTLRVDRVDGAGKVIARVETPFARSTVLASLDQEAFIVVQPGNSLWRIARRSYGQGVRYTVIYDANQGQIRDPDLIYPGQIFVVPPVN